MPMAQSRTTEARRTRSPKGLFSVPSVSSGFVLAILFVCGSAYAADPPPLARARMLYNSMDYDGAIAAAATARLQPTTADAAALVEARARLERYRHASDLMDLAAARDALNAIRASTLSPRDQVDFLIGVGQSLFLTDAFGPAAELFDTALERSAALPERDRLTLLDWWATALDREAEGSSPERRERLAGQIAVRMQAELRRDPGSAPANYWLAVAARAAGDLETAWDAAVAAWIRATLGPSSIELRTDIDHLMTDALIPERARLRRESPDLLRSQWNQVKDQWK